MYHTYWNLKRQPFGSTPDPSSYFTMHGEDDSRLSLIRKIDDGSRRLIVLTGPEGSGKTTCLRAVVEQLSHSDYEIAFVTNPANNLPSLLREIVGQLQHRALTSQSLGHFAHEFHVAADRASRAGRRTLVFIDDFAATSMPDLAALHSLIADKSTMMRPATFVLAGKPDLSAKLLDPACSELFGSTALHLRMMPIPDKLAMRAYIAKQLQHAGMLQAMPFTDEALDALWENPRNHIPRALNSACRLCLKQAAEKVLPEVDGETARRVSSDLTNHPLETLPPHQALGAIAASLRTTPTAKGSQIMPAAPLPAEVAKARLASQLASNHLKHLDMEKDPFDEWSSAREDILNALKSKHLRPVMQTRF